MRWRRLLLAFLAAALMLLPATAAAADPMVPERPAKAPAYTGNPPLYDHPQIEPWAYTFDGLRMSDPGYASTYAFMNGLMVAKAWLLKMAIRVVEYTLSQDFFEPFTSRVDKTLLVLGQALWSVKGASLVVGALSLTALWSVLLYLRGRAVRMWGTLGATVLVLMLFGILSATGMVSAKAAVKAARDLSLHVYGAVERISGGPGVPPLVQRAGEAAWQSLVLEPWAVGEFGPPNGQTDGAARFAANDIPGGMFLTVRPAERRVYRYFANEVGSCAIPSGFQIRYCSWWDEDYLPRRLFLAGWTFLATLMFAGATVGLAGAMVVAQIALMLFLALSPIWLLVLLWWPGAVSTLLQRLTTRVVAALVSMSVLAASLSLLLYLTEVVGRGGPFEAAGWMFQSIILALLGVLAFRYRYAWLVPLSALADRRPEPLDTGAFDRLRGVLTGRSRTPAVVAPPSGVVTNTVREPLPVFARLEAPTVHVQADYDRAAQGVEVREESFHISQRDVFHQQMRVLRDQLSVREEVLRGEPVPREQGHEWEEPAPAQPARAARARERSRPQTEIPRQRPQG